MRLTKKDLVLSLHAGGRTVREISTAIECHPSFIERWIREAGKTPYTDADLEQDRARKWVAKAGR